MMINGELYRQYAISEPRDTDIEYRKMVKEMLDTEDKGFNNWEIEFLDDMFKRRTYTVKQMKKIDQIYDSKM